MKTRIEIENSLAQCSETEGYRFNYITKAVGMVYTDGVKLMMDLCEANWIIDIIASYQKKAMKDDMLRDMQFWTLTVEDNEATIICERDTGDVAYKQEISFTDFPLSEIKIWLERGYTDIGNGPQEVMVAMLPSER